MRVQVPHTLGRDGARRKLADFADGLAIRAWPGGVDVRDVVKNWVGDRLDFSFVAARGFFSVPIRGWLDVEDGHIVLDAAVPPMLASLVGEDRIQSVLADEIGRILSQP